MTSTDAAEIQVLDLHSLTREHLLAMHELSRVLQAERDPEAPEVPVERVLAEHAALPDFFQGRYALIRDGNAGLVAAAHVGWLDMPENAHLAQVDMSVHPHYRRRGLGRRLAAALVAQASEAGRRLLVFGTDERLPAGAEFARWLGAQQGSESHTNRLLLADVDRPLLERWVDEAREKSAGYELAQVPWPYPEEWLAPLADLFQVINDAPHDDLDVEPMRIDAEMVRQQVAQELAGGRTEWLWVARHTESGELAGLHNLVFSADDPKSAQVGLTVVRPEHRGHALGRWLKAVATLRVLDERSEVKDIRTGNADSNEAMLRINHEMGYRPYVALTTWQVELADAARRLQG